MKHSNGLRNGKEICRGYTYIANQCSNLSERYIWRDLSSAVLHFHFFIHSVIYLFIYFRGGREGYIEWRGNRQENEKNKTKQCTVESNMDFEWG